tara:strand:- start:93 stop:293 length:201 start_codon:yes stop_codon:yes gene_type:complete
MEKYTIYVKDDYIQIQEADYVEHGWIIKIKGKFIWLYEIPYGGGEEMLIGDFKTLEKAICYSKTLT